MYAHPTHVFCLHTAMCIWHDAMPNNISCALESASFCMTHVLYEHEYIQAKIRVIKGSRADKGCLPTAGAAVPSFPERPRVPRFCHSILHGSFVVPKEHKPQSIGAQQAKPLIGWCRIVSECLSSDATVMLHVCRGLNSRTARDDPSVHATPASFTIIRICCYWPAVMSSSSCRSRRERRVSLLLDRGLRTVTLQGCPAMSKQREGLPTRVPLSHACA